MKDDDQGDLFNLGKGRDERDEGIGRVERNSDSFLAIMRAYALKHCTEHGRVSIDELRRYAEANNLAPRHPNVWGAIFKEAGWTRIGTKQSVKVSNHARWVHVWCYVPPPGKA